MPRQCSGASAIPVEHDMFDLLFNGRSGYRAQYYLSANAGGLFNLMVVTAFARAVASGLGQGSCAGRRSIVDGSVEQDLGHWGRRALQAGPDWRVPTASMGSAHRCICLARSATSGCALDRCEGYMDR